MQKLFAPLLVESMYMLPKRQKEKEGNVYRLFITAQVSFNRQNTKNGIADMIINYTDIFRDYEIPSRRHFSTVLFVIICYVKS